MTGGQYAVVLVFSTSHALRAEKVLKEAGIPSKLIPVPRHLSSDCGVCVRIDKTQVESARRELGAAGVDVGGIHDD